MKKSAVILALAVGVALAAPAFAQDASTTVDATPLLAAVENQLVSLFAIVALGVLTWATTTIGAAVKKKFGVDVTTGLMQQEQIHRDALQTALTNAAGAVLQRVGSNVDVSKINVGDPAIKAAADQMLTSVPEALDHFGLTAAQLAPKILAKLPQVQSATPPVVVNVPAAAAPDKE